MNFLLVVMMTLVHQVSTSTGGIQERNIQTLNKVRSVGVGIIKLASTPALQRVVVQVWSRSS